MQGAEGYAVWGQGVNKRFGSHTALYPLDFAVKHGTIYGLLGANGGGKSTLLKMIAGIERPDSGLLSCLGNESYSKAEHHYQNIGYMAQSFALYPMLSAYENIRFKASLYNLPDPQKATDETISTYGLDAYRDVRAENLSGGWARKLQLAAGLVHEPSLVLLDEPTAGLDAEARRTVWHHIRRIVEGGSTVIVATHDMIEAEYCHELLCLSEGNVIAAGNEAEVIEAAQAIKCAEPANRDDVFARLRAEGAVFAHATNPRNTSLIVGQEAISLLPDSSLQPVDEPITLEEATIILKKRSEGITFKSAPGSA